MRSRVRGYYEGCDERCEMRRFCKLCYACICDVDICGGELERAVERKLGCVAKAARDEG